MQPWAKRFYSSKAWKDCRLAYIAQRVIIDGGLCECCHEQLGYIVHHKIMLTESNISDPNISLSFDNLRYDCKDCHDDEEGHFNDTVGKIKNKCLFDAEGNPIKK